MEGAYVLTFQLTPHRNEIVDFGELPVFEDAAVMTAILLDPTRIC